MGARAVEARTRWGIRGEPSSIPGPGTARRSNPGSGTILPGRHHLNWVLLRGRREPRLDRMDTHATGPELLGVNIDEEGHAQHLVEAVPEADGKETGKAEDVPELLRHKEGKPVVITKPVKQSHYISDNVVGIRIKGQAGRPTLIACQSGLIL